MSDLESVQTVLENIIRLNESHLSLIIGEPKVTLEFLKHYVRQYTPLFYSWKLKFPQGLIVLDFKDHFGQDDGFQYNFPVLNLFSISKEVFLHHFDTIIHQIRQNFQGMNLTSNGLMTAYNCVNVVHNFLLKMVQIIKFSKYPLNLFQYRTFGNYKRGLRIRSVTNKDEFRDLYRVSYVHSTGSGSRFDTQEKDIDYLANLIRRTKQCFNPTCLRGTENYFGQLPSDRLGIWSNDSFGWSCQQCPVNHFQPNDTKPHS